jgi:ubiquitin-like protein Pup
MEQKRVKKPAPLERKAEESVEPAESVSAEEAKTKADELLDEIDSLLEENAEEFVRNYVQKGGE